MNLTKKKFIDLIGRKVDSIEFYPASEGFFAFQNNQRSKDLLLLLNSGIFYEFISVEDFNQNIFKRITVKDVKLKTNYVLIISTNEVLWAYNTGETVPTLAAPRNRSTGANSSAIPGRLSYTYALLKCGLTATRD